MSSWAWAAVAFLLWAAIFTAAVLIVRVGGISDKQRDRARRRR